MPFPQTMINPPRPPEPPKPTLSDLAGRVQSRAEERSRRRREAKEAAKEVPEAEEKGQPLSVAGVEDTVSTNCAEVSWSSVVRGTPT